MGSPFFYRPIQTPAAHRSCLGYGFVEDLEYFHLGLKDQDTKKGAGAAPLTGLPSLSLVAALMPMSAPTIKQGQNKGFRQMLHQTKPICYDSRKFVSGIMVCPNL